LEKYELAENAVRRSTTAGLTMLFDRRKGVMYELNETASAVIELLGGGAATTDELVSGLAEQFEASIEEIRSDVLKMIEDFIKSELVVLRPTPQSGVSSP
jgi:hypothetical protein